jgi:hypothetical protein
MTPEKLTERIAAKEAERQQIILADQQQGQERQKQFEANVKRVNQLEGAIAELKELQSSLGEVA